MHPRDSASTACYPLHVRPGPHDEMDDEQKAAKRMSFGDSVKKD